MAICCLRICICPTCEQTRERTGRTGRHLRARVRRQTPRQLLTGSHVLPKNGGIALRAESNVTRMEHEREPRPGMPGGLRGADPSIARGPVFTKGPVVLSVQVSKASVKELDVCSPGVSSPGVAAASSSPTSFVCLHLNKR